MTRGGLTTDGSEFVLPDGTPYRGPYHIHYPSGAMVGPSHTGRSHSYLKPVNNDVRKMVTGVMAELMGDTSRPSSRPRSTSSYRGTASRGSSRTTQRSTGGGTSRSGGGGY